MIRARTIWLKVHLYLALILGGFIALLAATGAILTYYPEVDRLLNPALRQSTSWPPRLSADQAMASVQSTLHVQPSLLWMPHRADNTYVADLFDPTQEVFRLVTVDAGDGRILADRVWGRTFVTVLFNLHTGLLLGERGLPLVGALAVALLASVFTGLYLWWPRSSTLKQAFIPRLTRHPVALNFDIHRLTGLYLLPVIVVITISGISFSFPSAFEAVVGAFSPVAKESEWRSPKSHVPDGTAVARVSLAQVQDSIERHFPGTRIASISIPEATDDPYSIRIVDRGEPENRNGRSTVWVDAYSGAVLSSYAYSKLNAGDRFIALQLPLHTGEYLGNAGRILAALSGIAICALYGTGLYLWLARRSRSKRTSRNPSVK